MPGQSELYNLQDDPHEQNNLYDTERAVAAERATALRFKQGQNIETCRLGESRTDSAFDLPPPRAFRHLDQIPMFLQWSHHPRSGRKYGTIVQERTAGGIEVAKKPVAA